MAGVSQLQRSHSHGNGSPVWSACALSCFFIHGSYAETVLFVNKPLVTMVTITRTLLYVHKFRVTMETGTETFLYVNEQSVTVANCNAGSTPGERSTIAHDHSHASSERCVSECS
uniref:Uncharacterized protein n=1 Tax=Cacopsylla melanoneura TaxID=428564 RepID=A0A8D8ZRY3_9HEMI